MPNRTASVPPGRAVRDTLRMTGVPCPGDGGGLLPSRTRLSAPVAAARNVQDPSPGDPARIAARGNDTMAFIMLLALAGMIVSVR